MSKSLKELIKEIKEEGDRRAVLDFLNERIRECIRHFRWIENKSETNYPQVYEQYATYIFREYWQQKQLLIKKHE